MYEDLKNDLADWRDATCNSSVDATVVRAITAIEKLEAELITAKARIAELEEALGDICKDSNPDWIEKRIYPIDVLDDIHGTAVAAYYSKTHISK